MFFAKIPRWCHWAELLGEVWKWLDVSLPKQRRTSPHFWRCTPWNTWRWGESGNPLRIDQWFCMLERWSEEDRAMLLIQSVQLNWKLNLLPTCWSGTPFCRNLLLPTNDLVCSGDNLFACGLGRFPSWGLGGMILEVIRMVKEDGAMLSIQSIQLTWKLNLLPTCWSGTPFCRNLLLPTNDFGGSGDNLLACG